MSTSDRTPGDDTGVVQPTGPGPDSTDAVSPTAGAGTAQPDTGPGPAAADVDDEPHGGR